MNSLPGLPLLLAALVIALIACGPSAPYDEAEAPFAGVTVAPQEDPTTPPDPTETPTADSGGGSGDAKPAEAGNTIVTAGDPDSTPEPTATPTATPTARKIGPYIYNAALEYEKQLREGEEHDNRRTQRQTVDFSFPALIYPVSDEDEIVEAISDFLTDNNVEYQLMPTEGDFTRVFRTYISISTALGLEKLEQVASIDSMGKEVVPETYIETLQEVDSGK